MTKRGFWGGIIVLILFMFPVMNSIAQSCGTCNWYGTNFPVCCNVTSGWGWENNKSCISRNDCVNAGQTCTGCNGGTTTTSTGGSTTTSFSGTTTSSGSGNIIVRARGTKGGEKLEVRVNGTTVATHTLSASYANYSADGSGTIRVAFTNDDQQSSGMDIQVDYVNIDGTTYQAENQATNTGVYQNSQCGGSNSEWLHCNGYIEFSGGSSTPGPTNPPGSTTTTSYGSTTTSSGVSTTTSTGGSGNITVRARGTRGGEKLEVRVNGTTVATHTMSASYANYSASGSGTIRVAFTNDDQQSSGMDIQVDYVTIDGTTYQAENQATNTGVYQNSQCGGSNSEWLHCNGYIEFSTGGTSTPGPTNPPGSTTTTSTSGSGNSHAFLLLGQSNMAGYPKAQSSDKQQNSRILVLGFDSCSATGSQDGVWRVAVPPLHECSQGAIGPGDWFAKTIISRYPSNDTIRLVPCAISGEKIETFMKNGGSRYSWIINRAKAAQQAGATIDGILFNQGESNNGQSDWPNKVKQLVSDLKADLGLGNIPFLAGELLYSGSCSGHNTLINQLPNVISNCKVVSASGLVVDPADTQWKLHFGHDSQVTFGQRYAQAMIQALGL